MRSIYCLFLISFFCSQSAFAQKSATSSEIDVAAYFWPSLQNEQRSKELFWSEGMGEWEVINKSKPRFEGHYQPRQPIWGYTLDDEPAVMERQIEEATDHGVNVFIFDWYWYESEPFLEEALNDGFLKAKNKDKMSFYLMWANHDVPGNMWNPYRYMTDDLILEGSVNQNEYDALIDRVINKYFKKPNYYKIDNKPVLSIYSLEELVQSFGDLTGVKKALDQLRAATVKAGFSGLHLQFVGKYGANNTPSLGEGLTNVSEITKLLNPQTVTMYNMAGKEYRSGDYIPYAQKAKEVRQKWDEAVEIPFVPCISVGWDTTPRFLDMGKEEIVYIHNTPASFGASLLLANDFLIQRPNQPQLIIINAWNEWVEGSYLRPDMLNGYGYLEAVKAVFEK